MSNVYLRLKTDLGLQSDAQGTNEEFSWLYLLLDKLGAMEAANPTGDTIVGNDYRELLEVRLNAYKDTFAYQNRIAPFLKSRAEKR